MSVHGEQGRLKRSDPRALLNRNDFDYNSHSPARLNPYERTTEISLVVFPFPIRIGAESLSQDWRGGLSLMRFCMRVLR